MKLLWQRDGAPSSTWDAIKKALSDFPSEETALREFPDRYDEIMQYKPRAWNWLILSYGASIVFVSSIMPLIHPNNTSIVVSLSIVFLTAILLMRGVDVSLPNRYTCTRILLLDEKH